MAIADPNHAPFAASRAVALVVTTAVVLAAACTGRDVPVGTLRTDRTVDVHSSEKHSEPETAVADTRDVSLVDTLALVPADSGCFNIHVGDLNAFRAAFDLPAPTADTSRFELTEQLQTIAPLTVHGLPDGLADVEGDRSILVPLARSSAYVVNLHRATEVFAGDFASDTFGPLPPDEVLDAVYSLPVPSMTEEGFGSERLTVDNGTVTVASTPDDLAATLAAQHGEVDTLADVSEAVELVSVLDDLDVIHADAARIATTELIDGNAGGVSVDPDKPGSWLLHMLFRPRDEHGLDALTSTIAERASAAADKHDAEVVEVAPREGIMLATIRFAEPNGWLDIQSDLTPHHWDNFYTELDAEC